MIQSKQLYDAIQLAEASYTLFDASPTVPPGDDAGLATALQQVTREGKLSSSQAQALANSWSLVSHRPDTLSGFSATLFQQKANTTDYVFALRGTEFTREPGLDLGQADLGGIIIDGVSVNQIVDLYNYWKKLTAVEGATVRLALVATTTDAAASGIFDEVPDSGTYKRIVFFDQSNAGIGAITGPVTSLTVTGHSLGGHLSTAFQRLFPGTGAEVVTVNGMGTRENALTSAFFDALAERSGTTFDASHIANVFGSAGTDLATGEFLYTQQGIRSELFTESFGPGAVFGHGGNQMTDSAAVYDLFIKLNSSLSNQRGQHQLTF